MKGKTLNERLADSRGEPFEYEGLTVHGLFRREVHPDDIVQVQFVQGTQAVRQGVRLKIEKGRLLVNGLRSKDGVLWKDIAPEVVEVVCQPPRSGARLSLWNVWEKDGILGAWSNNAGILVETQDDVVVLKCSDGVGEPDFQDLIVELRFIHRHKNP